MLQINNKYLLLLSLLINYSWAANPMKDERETHFILHFDVNKTIIAMDAVQGKDLEETVNGILAEFTLARWDGRNQQSYYEYLTNEIAKEKPQLSRTSEEFKKERNLRLKVFSEYLQKSQPDLYKKYESEKMRMMKILSAQKMVIFPSFYNLIHWLDQNRYNYTIQLRTFGTDLPEVIPTIERQSSLKFAHRGAFKGETLQIFKDKLGTNSTVIATYTTPQQIYTLFLSGDCAIQDDYNYWKSKGFQAVGGKFFPIDMQDQKVISIFFDDNANDVDKPIIHPVSLQGELLDTKMLMARGNIVAINPKEAILDPNYFVAKVNAKVPKVMPQKIPIESAQMQ